MYVVASTFEDYADLLTEREGDLPRMQRDITPYFSGFLGSRLAPARRERGASATRLSQAEVTALLAEAVANAPYPSAALGAAWDSFERSDHHDFIAGTALDPIVTGEQAPLLASLQTTASGFVSTAMTALAGAVAPDSAAPASVIVAGTVGATGPREASASCPSACPMGAAHNLSADTPSQVLSSTTYSDGSIQTAELLLAVPSVAPLSYQRISVHDAAPTGPVSVTDDGTNVTLIDASTGLRAVIDHATGMLQSLQLYSHEWLSAPSLEIVQWMDQGGLYRIGSETHGCHFTSQGALPSAATVQVLEQGPARARVDIVRGAVSLEIRLTAGTGRLDVSVSASAAMGYTLTMPIHTNATGATGAFAHAAGVVERPPQQLYTPTFWPTVRGVDLAESDGSGFAMLPQFSTGVRYDTAGTIELDGLARRDDGGAHMLGASGETESRFTPRSLCRCGRTRARSSCSPRRWPCCPHRRRRWWGRGRRRRAGHFSVSPAAASS